MIKQSKYDCSGTFVRSIGSVRWQWRAPELLIELRNAHFNIVPCVVTAASDIYSFAVVCVEVSALCISALM